MPNLVVISTSLDVEEKSEKKCIPSHRLQIVWFKIVKLLHTTCVMNRTYAIGSNVFFLE